ncbi:MAG TPA: AbrB/MazE/SpoVT family DNA-binding domain-containing protein [Arcobacter sp.]|nr:AbrB/MazE/SpoVT family DNA-binding domain-containing protein [Arcobacter sp.]HIP56265.1 AbrB/MazE/SpoVT family DNA-binding domain-containing protein [Arcobacter sp.]
MTMLTRIGNSQGIRIPKPLIAQAHLENVQIDLEVVENGLLIKPILTSRRENWKDNIANVLLENKNTEDKAVIDELLNDNDLEDYQW